jgi:hypothetical protein
LPRRGRLSLPAAFQDVDKRFQARQKAGSARVLVKAQRKNRDATLALQGEQGIVGHHFRRAAKGRQVDHPVHVLARKERRIPDRLLGEPADLS